MRKHKGIPYCVFIAVFYVAEALFLPYVVMLLTDQGLSTTQASLAYSGMTIGAIAGGLLLGMVADKTRNPKGTLMTSVFLAAGLVMLILRCRSFAMAAAVLFLFGFFEQPAIDLFDNLIVHNVPSWEKTYNVIHCFGNLGYVIGLLLAGSMLGAYGYPLLLGSAAAMLVVSGISTTSMGNGILGNRKRGKLPLRALLRNWMAVAIYLVSFLWGVIETGTLAFATKYYTDLGYTAGYAAVMISIAIAGQLLSYTFMYRKPGALPKPVLCAAGFCLLGVRILSMALVNALPFAVLALMAFLGGACTPLITLALVRIVSENFPVEVSNSAQTFKTIAYRGLGGSLGSYLFGFFYEWVAPERLMLLGAAVSGVFALLALVIFHQAKKWDGAA